MDSIIGWIQLFILSLQNLSVFTKIWHVMYTIKLNDSSYESIGLYFMTRFSKVNILLVLVSDLYRRFMKWNAFSIAVYREDYFIVGVSNCSTSSSGCPPDRGTYPLCGQYCSTARGGGVLVVFCKSSTTGRYVIIQQPLDGQGYLNFCELEVYGIAWKKERHAIKNFNDKHKLSECPLLWIFLLFS